MAKYTGRLTTQSLLRIWRMVRVPLDNCVRLHGTCQSLLYRKKSHPPPSMLRIPGPGLVDRCMSPVRLSIMAHIPVVAEPKISPNACQHCRCCSRSPLSFPRSDTAVYLKKKKKPFLITRSLLYSYINAGQQSPMVGTELAAAQPLDTVAPHHPGPASQQSPAQRSVKCRYFASRKGRQSCS